MAPPPFLQRCRCKTDDGFVVIKLKPRRGKSRYAISSVSFSGELGSYVFPPNTGVLVFDAPRGKVTYIGGFTVDFASEGLTNGARLRDDPSITRAQAAAFMVRRYPQIKAEPVMGRVHWLYGGDDDYDYHN